MAWQPDNVIKSKYKNADTKGNYSEFFKGDITGDNLCIEAKKLADHPIAVGGDPNGDGNIVTKL